MPMHKRRPRPGQPRTRRLLRELQRRAEMMVSGQCQDHGRPLGGPAEIEDLRRTIDVLGEHVEQAQRTMHAYIGALTTAQEAERGRLARELHDDTVQQLIVVAQGVDRLGRVYERTPERVPEQLAALRSEITDLIQALRTTIANLRPPALEELGLVPALKLFFQPSTTAGPTVSLVIDGDPRRLDPDSELAVFRIVQEAWSNTRRHAQAAHAELRLHYGRRIVEVTFCDDGQGFAPPSAGATAPGRWGLLGMHERAALAGGTLALTSQPGQGTCVTLSLPDPGVGRRDPVCGMDVRPTDAGAEYQDQLYRFCSLACRELFLSNPQRYLPTS